MTFDRNLRLKDTLQRKVSFLKSCSTLPSYCIDVKIVPPCDRERMLGPFALESAPLHGRNWAKIAEMAVTFVSGHVAERSSHQWNEINKGYKFYFRRMSQSRFVRA